MFIIAQKNGRLCNRLFLFARIMALAKEHDHKLVDFSLREYAALFDISRLASVNVLVMENILGKSNASARSTDFILRASVKILVVMQSYIPLLRYVVEVVTPPELGRVDLDDLAWRDRFKRKFKIYIFCDWWSLAPKSFIKNKTHVLNNIRPLEHKNTEIRELSKELKKDCDLLIGLVVRREDYKDYMEGKYFFSMNEYRVIADRMVTLLEDKKVRFFICSIDTEDCNAFDGLDFFYRAAHPIENLYTLSECDYILSPPSTFTMWSSLIGSVPAFYLDSPRASFNLDDFSVTTI